MDPLIEAIYRSGCLVAAAQAVTATTKDGPRPVDLEQVNRVADILFELVVPDELRAGELVDLNGPVEPHPNGEAFLEDVQRRAAEQLDAKDKQKMARAAAIADEEHSEFAPREGDLGISR